MSARRLIALLVVVTLGLLLSSPTALSRSEPPSHEVGAWYGPGNTQDDGSDDDDPDIPNGFIDGDDDNWDKSSTQEHSVAESFGANDGRATGFGSGETVEEVSPIEFGLRFRLALLLRSWIILAGTR